MNFRTDVLLSQNALRSAKIDPVATDPVSPVSGQMWYNTTSNRLKYYDGGVVREIVSPETGDTLLNKVFDANGSGNSISNLEVADFAASVVTHDLVTSALSTQFADAAAIKSYVDSNTSSLTDPLLFKGGIDASTTPNYPAADAGDLYKITVAGKIGGASGPAVEVGDTIICTVDSSATGDHATVGANWIILQANIDAATDSVPGYVELATVSESEAKTDTARAVTPAGLASFVRRYGADVTNSTGQTILAATHGLGATKHLQVAVYEEDGTTNNQVIVDVSVADNGDVTWASNTAITGHIVIMG